MKRYDIGKDAMSRGEYILASDFDALKERAWKVLYEKAPTQSYALFKAIFKEEA